jgi:hypothetical protein
MIRITFGFSVSAEKDGALAEMRRARAVRSIFMERKHRDPSGVVEQKTAHPPFFGAPIVSLLWQKYFITTLLTFQAPTSRHGAMYILG